jgi:hypothetical protein
VKSFHFRKLTELYKISNIQFAFADFIMRRIAALIASAALNTIVIPAVASECESIKDINASRLRWEMVRSRPAKATDSEKICRAYAASFYESVSLRLAAARCVGSERNLTALDSEINAFNDLLAKKCGG